jgi:hypothetical protein
MIDLNGEYVDIIQPEVESYDEYHTNVNISTTQEDLDLAYSDARAASAAISEYVLPQIEGSLSFLLMQGLVDIRQDLAVQLFGHMQVYHKIIDVNYCASLIWYLFIYLYQKIF